MCGVEVVAMVGANRGIYENEDKSERGWESERRSVDGNLLSKQT